MSKPSTYEEQLRIHGKLLYTNVGDSMYPLLRQKRDLLIISPRPEGRCQKYDVVLYRRPNGRCVLHRILKVTEEGYIICGDNRREREKVPEDWIFGILTGIVRDGKEMSVTDRKYRMYVHLWYDFFWVRWAVLGIRNKFARWKRKNESKNR